MIKINMDKARQIAHGIRRDLRSKEFEPHDQIIMKQIPGSNNSVAENARESIRQKYQQVQILVDKAETPQELRSALGL
jgi:hypothetical protein